MVIVYPVGPKLYPDTLLMTEAQDRAFRRRRTRNSDEDNPSRIRPHLPVRFDRQGACPGGGLALGKAAAQTAPFGTPF